MDKDVQKYCLEVLELPQGSSWSEITRSYNNLKQLYSSPSIAMHPIEDDFSEASREEILEQVENAYRELEKVYAFSKKNLDKNIKTIISKIDFFNGQALKKIRKGLQFKLDDIAAETKIQLSLLKSLENEEYESLPREIYIIGCLKNYARHLSLDPKRVVADYLQGYKKWSAKQPKQ